MFDPYDKWLGIPKGQRPVDYFLLLDLDPEERDPKVIRAAAGRQAARLTLHEDGPHAKGCAPLLKEMNRPGATRGRQGQEQRGGQTFAETSPARPDGTCLAVGRAGRRRPPPPRGRV